MKRRGTLLAVLLTAMMALAFDAYAQKAGVPDEVRAHVAQNWSGYELFDYIEVSNTPKGDYGFALLSHGRGKTLIGYREQDGRMMYWLKNAAAVPQGEGISYAQWQADPDQAKDVFVLSQLSEHDVKNIDGNRIVEYGDRLGFSVSKLTPDPERGLANRQSAVFYWEEGEFKLSEYRNDDIWYGPVFVSENRLDFYRGEWEYAGTAKGVFQRSLRYVSLTALPATLNDAWAELSVPPEIRADAFTDIKGREVRFTGGQKYAVYTGPGEVYARSGNGKGMVSTNDWIQVFGQENGWLMIQYDITGERYRIGYIPLAALPKGEAAEPMTWRRAGRAYAVGDAEITDDPLGSAGVVAMLKSGERFLWLGSMGEWAYVEIEREGQKMRGFTPAEGICMEPFDFSQTAKNLLTEVYGYSAKEADEEFLYAFYEQNRGVYAVFHPKSHPNWTYSYWQDKATREVVDAKSPFATSYAGYLGEGTVRFELSNQNFTSGEEIDAFFMRHYGPKSGWSIALTEWCEEAKAGIEKK